MNLMKFKGADDAVKYYRLSAGYCIILTIALPAVSSSLSTK